MSSLLRHSDWNGRTLEFFDDFRELAEATTYADPALPESAEVVALSNPVCGDQVRVRVRFEEGTLRSFVYQQRGCWPVAGCLELLGRVSARATLDDVLAFRLDDFLLLVRNIPPSKRHAFSLTHRALLAAASQALRSGSGN